MLNDGECAVGENCADFFPYGKTKRPSGISYLDAFKQFEIYPHPNSGGGYNDNISDPVTIAVWDTMVDITHPNFQDPVNQNNHAIWQCPGGSCYDGEYGPGFTDFTSQAIDNATDDVITGFCKSGEDYEFTPGLRCIKDCAGQCVPEKFLYDGICWSGTDSIFYLENNWGHISDQIYNNIPLSQVLSPILVETSGAGELFDYWHHDEDFIRCKDENDGQMPDDQVETLAPNFRRRYL